MKKKAAKKTLFACGLSDAALLQAGKGTNYILEGAFAFFRCLARHEPAAFFYFGGLSLTAICYLCSFGSPRMGCVSSRTAHPQIFTAEPVRRLSIDSAVQFTPHHILERGAKTALSDAIELYELPSGSRNHILELREKGRSGECSGVMSGIVLSTKLHRNLPHGSPGGAAAAAAAERSP